MTNFEKPAHSSKKFIAFFFVVIILAAMAAIFSFTQTLGAALSPVLLGIVLTIGFIGVAYIFSTAVLDKYMRIPEIFKGKTNGEDE